MDPGAGAVQQKSICPIFFADQMFTSQLGVLDSETGQAVYVGRTVFDLSAVNLVINTTGITNSAKYRKISVLQLHWKPAVWINSPVQTYTYIAGQNVPHGCDTRHLYKNQTPALLDIKGNGPLLLFSTQEEKRNTNNRFAILKLETRFAEKRNLHSVAYLSLSRPGSLNLEKVKLS